MPKMEEHRRVANVVRQFGDLWQAEENIVKICAELDRAKLPVPPSWAKRRPPSRSWMRAAENSPRAIIQWIKYRLKMVAR